MNNLSMIVAIGKNNEIGKDNKLLWHLPNDLKFFKEKTLNKIIIMGSKTFESLPKKLPNRKHVVITDNHDFKDDDVTIFHSIDETLTFLKETSEECFVIGGMSIYKQLLPYVKNLYITKIEDSKEADAYFPTINETDYDIIYLGENEDNNIKYKHYKYIKK